MYIEGALYFYALLSRDYVPLSILFANLANHNETTAIHLTAFHTPYNNAQIALSYLFVILVPPKPHCLNEQSLQP